MTQKFPNNARSRLVGSLSAGATSFTVEAPTADLFPVANTTDWLTKLDWFKATLEKSTGEVEIVHVGVRNSGSGLFSNVLRGQDGTTALSFDAGTTVGVRLTGQDIEQALTGDFDQLDVEGDAVIDGKLTHNGIETRPVPVGGIIMYSGLIAAIPAGWQLCDGTNGTVDLRDKFIVGARQDDAGVVKTNITGALTQSGGSKDAIAVAHTHTFAATTGNESANHTHSGTTSTAGAHAHGVTYASGSNTGSSFPSRLSESGITSVATAAAGDHNHTMTTGAQSANHTHSLTGTTASTGAAGTNANLPPYYALAFIACMPYA